MTDAQQAYDPVGDLAQLLSGLRMLPGPEYPGDLRAVLSGLVHGPVARLNAGLRLDDPAVASRGTETAIREALASFITRTGHLITPAEIEGWVAEAERGYEVPWPRTLAELEAHAAERGYEVPACYYRDADGLHDEPRPGTEDPEGE